MTPESRKIDLLAQTVGDELVIYDERTHEAHRLSATAALVWRLADGRRTIDEIARRLRGSIDELASGSGGTADDETSEQIVEHAIAELSRAGLLASDLP